MSFSFRPVVETWGTASSCFVDGDALEQILLDLAEFSDPSGITETNDYSDNRVVWIQNGNALLNFIDGNSIEELFDQNSDWALGSDEEVANIRTVLENMKSLCTEWCKSVGKDGSIRFYIDSY